ncbi:CHAT domain-containing protein [Pseudanabaena sp. UWO310]|uniref:CHAT domain-containing protein n=1 Tax=Pseudanabaena sp. UWO310 TaxID=2480795 RepID=UPI00115A1802|nr:CHAT domain-containing protein [Pseudanabaena sp. UWO310]TYQ30842.1 CHAT domain-containing protein [Pseudanabaena sp. UWO310]
MKCKALLMTIASALILMPSLSEAAGIRNPSIPNPSQEEASEADQLLQAGIQYFRAKQFESAFASWRKALDIYRQQSNRQGEKKVLEAFAKASKMLGQYQQAIDYSQQWLAFAKKIGDRQTEADALGNLGNNYRLVGDYAKALDAQTQGLIIRKELNDRQGEEQVLESLGSIHYDLGNYDKAEALYRQSLAIAKAEGDNYGVVFLLNKLGLLAGINEDYKQAIAYYQQSLNIAKQELAKQELAKQKDFWEVAGNALNNIGSIYHIQHQYQEAIANYERALTIAKEIKNPRMEGTAVGGLGLAYVFLEDYDRALALQEQSWQLAKQIGDRRLEALTLSNLGYTLWRSQKYPEAEQKFLTALSLLESLRSDLSDSDKVSIFDTQLHAFNLLQQITIAQGKPESALVIAERGRARAFAELLSHRLNSDSTPKSDQEKERFNSPILSLPSVSINDIRRIAQQQNAVLVEYSLITDPSFIGQGKLKGEYTKLYIWVIQPSGEIAFRQIALDSNFVELIVDIRSILNDPSEIAQNPKDVFEKYHQLKQLHNILIQPIQDLLPSDSDTRVIFLPQALLFLVPFAALINPQNQFLLERYTVQIAPAIQVLDLTHQIRQMAQRINFQEILIVGNPTMPSLGNPPIPLPTLLGAEKEAEAIAALLHTKFLKGNAATKVEVVAKMKTARFIHLATHGLLDEYRKGDIPGAIALAPSAQDNGFLTASEIIQMRLNAELVVLSACKTGQGLLTGDGVIGLSRSLITAGVPSVVVSLWAVPDEPTTLLMTTFYQKFLANPNKAQALRQAMLATKAKYPDPIAWAAFTLIGEAN